MKTNLILIGVSGFLGQRFLEESQYLRNKYNIICCTSSLSGSSKINSIYCDSIITLEGLSINFINTLGDFILINMAYSSSGTPWRRIIETKKLLSHLSNICSASDNCKGFIEISSQSVFGYSLNSSINPWTKIPIVFNDYCQSKQEAEKIVIDKISPTNIPFAIVRVGNILGKGSLPWIDRPLRYLYTQNFEMLENLSGYSNCIYVKNLIDYLHFLLENKIPKSINNSVFHHLVDYPYLKWQDIYKSLNEENLHFCHDERKKQNNSILFSFKNLIIYITVKFFIYINVSKNIDEYVIYFLRTSQNLKKNLSKNKPVDLYLKKIFTEKNMFQKFLNVNFNFKYSKEDLINEVNNSILECQNPR